MENQIFDLNPTQVGVFVALTALIGVLTWWQCRGGQARGTAAEENSAHDYFLAGSGLPWFFVAGSITLTNLSTDQLVGMNGNQMLLLAWWELAAVVGLFLLAFVFLPVYYRYNCTTTTELLEKRYKNKHVRALIGVLFLLGNLLIYLPAILYSGSLFMMTMFGLNFAGDGPTPVAGEEGYLFNVLAISVFFAVLGGAYAILGGLRAVAVSDTFSGVGLLSLALVVVYLALQKVGFDITTEVPRERLTMLGAADSPIPWPTLFTGMILIQMFYWSTNQTITQRAMAAKTIKEAQKGVIAAAGIRLLIVPVIVVVPGVVAFKLYGDIDDQAYGRLVGDILPPYLSGAFAAMMAAGVLTTFNSILNSSAALYVCDIHQKYIKSEVNVPRLSTMVSILMVFLSLLLVPIYANAESIINLLQKLNGLLSMPILSAFALALLFNNVDYRAAIMGVIFGVSMYALYTFYLNVEVPPEVLDNVVVTEGREAIIKLHYIHFMAITFFTTLGFALFVNWAIFRKKATLRLGKGERITAV